MKMTIMSKVSLIIIVTVAIIIIIIIAITMIVVAISISIIDTVKRAAMILACASNDRRRHTQSQC